MSVSNKCYGVLSAAALVFAAGQASAGALGAPNEIFIGGATAVQETFHLDIMLRFCNYDGNVNDADGVITPQVFVDQVLVIPGNGNGNNALPALNHRNQQVTHCNFKPALGAPLAGAQTAVYKFNGGSGTGVAPVANPAGASAAEQTYMNAFTGVGGCPQVIPSLNPGPDGTFLSVDGVTRFKLYDCPDTALNVTQAPDGGISDVEPKVFVGQLANGFGTAVPGATEIPANDFVDSGNLIVKTGPGIVFGVAATLAMYDELIDDQRAAGLLLTCPAAPTRAQRDSLLCMPSFPTAMVQSVATGELSSWITRAPYGLPLNPPAFSDPDGAGPLQGAQGNKVNFVRRTSGSGTHAQFMVNFLRTNCINGSPLVRTFANNVSQALAFPQVYENAGSGNIDQAMQALATGGGYNGGFTDGLTAFPAAPTAGNGNSSVVPTGRTAYALTYNSLERNASLARQYRFMKLDFVAPTLENAHSGAYSDVYYLSYQNRVNGLGDPETRTGGIRTVAADAGEIQVLKSFFADWNSPNPAAVDAVNDGLVVNPDGIAANGDEWQGGLISASRSAPQVFAGGPLGNDPRTPWARETTGGTADSCQELSYKN